ncbi:hypothetical protein ACWGPD_11505 [Streptomyces hirsutus]|uniref:hypothetical protein n=1 Tax=Streptomyces hirsutus TaxID=35620 RepID=UPI00332E6AEE
MAESSSPPSPVDATYVEPSAEKVLQPGLNIGDLFRRNMTQPYVLQRLSERAWWAQSFNYGTVFYVGDQGVLVMDTLEGVYDNITRAIASATDKPVTAAVHPRYHADRIGDIGKYVDAARREGHELRIIGSAKTAQATDLSRSSFPRPTDLLDRPRDRFAFEGLTVELHGFEWAAPTDDHAAWLLAEDRILHSSDLIHPDQPPFWRFAGNERFHWHEDNLRQIHDLGWDHLSGSHGNVGTRVDIDFELSFVADLKEAVGNAMAAHPFSSFVDPGRARTPASWPTSSRPSPARPRTRCGRSTAACTASRKRPCPTPRWWRGRCTSTGEGGCHDRYSDCPGDHRRRGAEEGFLRVGVRRTGRSARRRGAGADRGHRPVPHRPGGPRPGVSGAAAGGTEAGRRGGRGSPEEGTEHLEAPPSGGGFQGPYLCEDLAVAFLDTVTRFGDGLPPRRLTRARKVADSGERGTFVTPLEVGKCLGPTGLYARGA